MTVAALTYSLHIHTSVKFMRLFQRQRQTSQLQQARIQAQVSSIHRFYNERVSMPRKLRQYEAKAALMRIDGFTEEKAAETIAKWHSAYQKRKRQRLMQQKLARQASAAPQKWSATSTQHPARAGSAHPPFHEPNTEVRRIRRAVKEEARTLLALPLAKKLRACELISHHQLEIARMEQLTRRDGSTTVEILIEKEWIDAATVRFFETVLPQTSIRQTKRSISYYLQLAGLLTAGQVASLHQARQITGMSFEEAAESKGWVKRQTIFFINACLNG